MADDETLRFYAQNAAAYAQHRKSPSGAALEAFLGAVTPGGHILELGCGNGMDAAHMLARGFAVDATDGTPELVAEAKTRIGSAARTMRFEDLDAVDVYDGVWACASLLHVPAKDLVGILARIRQALRAKGVFVASFKGGTGEGRDDLDRYYNYPSHEKLAADYAAAGWLDVSIETVLGSGYDEKPTQWLWVTARR